MASEDEVTGKILQIASDGKDHAKIEFVKACDGRAAKNTVYKYITKMVDDDKSLEVVQGTSKEHFMPRFRITPTGMITLTEMSLEKTFPSVFDGFSREDLQKVIETLGERLVLTRRLFRMSIEDFRKISEHLMAIGPHFVDDPYSLLPKNAQLVSSSETEEERKQAETAPRVRYFYKRENQPQQESSKTKRKGRRKRDPP
jgi:hypothetical protein